MQHVPVGQPVGQPARAATIAAPTSTPFPPSAAAPTIVIELLGEPKGKGRPRFARRTGHAYTPAKTASYEACLRHEATIAMADRPPLEGALHVEVNAYFGVPQSWSAKKRADALAGTIRPAKRPDLDNIAKMLDALNEVVWRDDAQVVRGLIEKHYSDRPRLRIEVAHFAQSLTAPSSLALAATPSNLSARHATRPCAKRGWPYPEILPCKREQGEPIASTGEDFPLSQEPSADD